jgi:hypothetical protein
VYDKLSYTEMIHLPVPEIYTEQFGITNVAIQLLVPDVYSEQFGIAKVFIHLLVPGVYIQP